MDVVTWTLAGEGNAHVVVAGLADSDDDNDDDNKDDNDDDGQSNARNGTNGQTNGQTNGHARAARGLPCVLRLSKATSTATPSQHTHTESELAKRAGFQSLVTERLFGRALVPHTSIVRVSPLLLKDIATVIDPLRSPDRRLTSFIDMSQTHALRVENTLLAHTLRSLLPDQAVPVAAKWHSLALEIKPKWAFIPAEASSRVCRFCGHQILRQTQQGKPASKFCPLRLFGGTRDQVRRALADLLETPQNNLKVFVDGAHVSHDLNKPTIQELFGSLDAFLDQMTKVLLSNPLLTMLQDHQGALHHDPAVIKSLVAGLAAAGIQESDIDSHLLDNIDQVLQDYASGSDASTDGLARICRFLLSMTLKDLSIMLVFTPSAYDHNTASLDRIRLIDVDSKSIANLSKWTKLQQEIDAAVAQAPLPDCVGIDRQ
ncbi:inositol-pentakisphosphate 2-kinase [Entophlyctis helioformis]|nr:inositol-pentakisphosphate 2-kinase [Entophlyctis helioformis]